MREQKIHSIRYNFIMNFIITASQFIFPLITFPYVSRVLQATGNGRVSFALSIANYFTMVASLGIPTYGVRACARVRDDKEKLSKTVQEIFLINIIVTVLVTITYLLSIAVLPQFQEDRILFYINGLNIVLNMFGMDWLFQALEQYDYITFRSLAFKLISLILMFALVHQQSDYIIYGAITVFAAVGSNILNFTRVHKLVVFKWTGNYNLRQHMKPILILFAQSLAVSIYTNLDTVMLGFMKTNQDVGYYNAAVKIKTILLSLVTSLGSVLLPRMSYYVKQNLKVKFKQTMLKALNFTLLMSIPLSLYFILYANESIRFLAGNGYTGAVLAMQIIIIAIIPIGITGVLGIQVLTALEKEKYVLCSVVSGAVINFVLNLIFIPIYGAAGTALATTIAEFIVLLVQVALTFKLLKEIAKGFRIWIYLIASTICALAASMIKLLGIKSTFFELLISTVLFFGIYGGCLLIAKEPIALEMLDLILKKLKLKCT